MAHNSLGKNFYEANFKQRADFSGTNFQGEARFCGTKFEEKLTSIIRSLKRLNLSE